MGPSEFSVPYLPDQLTTLLLTAGALAAGLLLWFGLALYVYWDTGQHPMAPGRRWAWVLAACVPVIGWLAYILAGRSSASPAPPAAAVRLNPHRQTLLKRVPSLRRRVPTLAAADLAHATQPHRSESNLPTIGPITRYVVRVLEGPHAGQEFRLLRLPARIGRVPGVDVNLSRDLGISRQQAEIYEQGEVLRIRDLDSAHGTRVNGLRITDQLVRATDQIMVGYSVLTVGRESEAA